MSDAIPSPPVALSSDMALCRELARALDRLGRPDEAIAHLRAALAESPDHPGALFDLGVLLHARGQAVQAAELFARAAPLAPDDAEIQYNLGTTLLDLGQTDAAVPPLTRAVGLDPAHYRAWYNLGLLLRGLGRDDEALAAFARVTALAPDHAEAMLAQALLAHRAGRWRDAEALFHRALALRPAWPEALYNLGVLLQDSGRLEEAIAAYRATLARVPEDGLAHHNLALALLAQGAFAEGWREYEWRLRVAPSPLPTPPCPPWRGEDLTGRRLLLRAEQGLGDTVQFARFAPLIRRMGGEPVLSAPRRLLALLSTLPDAPRLVAETDPPPDCAHSLPLSSLPFRLGLTGADLAMDRPYLHADAARAARWRARLWGDGTTTGALLPGEFAVGIVWQGNPAARIDPGRSIPLRHFAPLARIPGVRLIALQARDGLDQLAETAPDWSPLVLGPDYDCGPDAFLDAAAVMTTLDLIVTSDTAIAHLAGALGRPTWVALRTVPDWRWGIAGETSPWYPTLRLFRQASPGDWADVFQRMAGAMAPLAAAQAGRQGPT